MLDQPWARALPVRIAATVTAQLVPPCGERRHLDRSAQFALVARP
ncbi:hypothetical protein [Streptomyces sp. NPDC051567]